MKNQEQIQAWYIQGNGAMSQEESEQKEKGWWGEQNEDGSAEVQATLGLLEWEGLLLTGGVWQVVLSQVWFLPGVMTEWK